MIMKKSLLILPVMLVFAGGLQAKELYTMQDCIDLAMLNNPTIASYRSNLNAAEARVTSAASVFWPQISASGGVSRSRAEGALYEDFRYSDSTSASLSASMPLITFGKNYFSLTAQKKSYKASEYDYRDNINKIVFNLKKAYYNLVYALKSVEVYEESVRQYTLHLKQAQAFYDIGIKPKIDVTNAEVNLNSARLKLIEAQNSVRNNFSSLSNYMGIESTDYDIVTDVDFIRYEVVFDEVLARAMEMRPDILSAYNKTLSSRDSLSGKKADFFPDIKGSASYGKSGGDRLQYENGSVGVSASWTLFSGFKRKAALDEAKSNLESQMYSEEAVRQGALMDLRQTYSNLLDSENRIPVASQNVEKAKENASLAQGRYKVGIGSNIEVIDAEYSYRQAGLEYAKALTDYKIAVADILRAVGTR